MSDLIKLPILYSFRRCPYAMRARMALVVRQKSCIIREVLLKDKPKDLVQVSAKATVPVLVLACGKVIDESIDIMKWCYNLTNIAKDVKELIQTNDTKFKYHLDRYKYSDRYTAVNRVAERECLIPILNNLEKLLAQNGCLLSAKMDFTDYAIIPFIRQFVNTDLNWFKQCNYPNITNWLNAFIASELHSNIMQKYKPWHKSQQDCLFT